MNEIEQSPQVSCVSAFLRPRLKENRSPVSGRVPVRQHLADPPPVAMPPVVRQPLLGRGPFREVRVVEERLRRPVTSILPTVPVSRVLPPLVELFGRLLLVHPSSSVSDKELGSSAPLRLQRLYDSKRSVLSVSTKRPIIC